MPTPTLCTTLGWMYSTHIEWLLIHIAPGEIMSIHSHHALTSLTGSVTLKNSCTWIPAKLISCPRFHRPPTLPKKKNKKKTIQNNLVTACSLQFKSLPKSKVEIKHYHISGSAICSSFIQNKVLELAHFLSPTFQLLVARWQVWIGK